MPRRTAPNDKDRTLMTTPSDSTIVRAAIHPGIGLARVGNSVDAFYIGPLVPEPAPKQQGFYRDASGALKREAAQFRIYGYNAAGEVVAELTADNADITWTAHVANSKAAWYQWQIAMDIPEAAETVLPLRNATVADRASLTIDAGPQSITGRNAAPVDCSGAYTGVSVKIGELRTDEHGRLLFLGGHGVSASPTNTPIYIPTDPNSFINADGWYDDTCDGPISATVTIGGNSIPVDSAWVVTAPPNYAPQLKSERTLYDLLYDLYIQAGWMQALGTLSFSHDVYPILQRLSGLQWVNQGFATQYGEHGPYAFEDPAFVARLAMKPPAGQYDPNAELRRQVFNNFRPPNPPDGNQLPWPWIYGDAMEVPAGPSPRQNAAISQTQYDILQRWVNGDFVDDRADGLPATAPSDIDQMPLAAQPATIDRAAMEFCLADAFHPGCEMTWPMRHITLYRAPFRILERPPGQPEPDYGPTLDQAQALAPDGPLHAQGPGDINRWMGLPWQADTAFCRAGYDTAYDPYAPTFWPARVPNHVLTAADYQIVIDKAQPMSRRIDAFSNRTSWNKPLHGTTAQQMVQMTHIFGSMGLVEQRFDASVAPEFPALMMVASYGPDVAPADAATTSDAALAVPPRVNEDASDVEVALKAHPMAKLRLSGVNFASQSEADAAPLPVRRTRRPD
jgi:hypothetical protein